MQQNMERLSGSADIGNSSIFLTQPKEMDTLWTDLLAMPRVIKGKDLALQRHDTFQTRFYDVTQVGLETMILFTEEFPPDGVSQRHGHMNEAVFYILEGKGYEIHDGEKFDWEAGDVVIIPNGCVHRHVNADSEHPARALVINPKPIYILNMNLKAQRLVDRPDEGSH